LYVVSLTTPCLVKLLTVAPLALYLKLGRSGSVSVLTELANGAPATSVFVVDESATLCPSPALLLTPTHLSENVGPIVNPLAPSNVSISLFNFLRNTSTEPSYVCPGFPTTIVLP